MLKIILKDPFYCQICEKKQVLFFHIWSHEPNEIFHDHKYWHTYTKKIDIDKSERCFEIHKIFLQKYIYCI